MEVDSHAPPPRPPFAALRVLFNLDGAGVAGVPGPTWLATNEALLLSELAALFAADPACSDAAVLARVTAPEFLGAAVGNAHARSPPFPEGGPTWRAIVLAVLASGRAAAWDGDARVWAAALRGVVEADDVAMLAALVACPATRPAVGAAAQGLLLFVASTAAVGCLAAVGAEVNAVTFFRTLDDVNDLVTPVCACAPRAVGPLLAAGADPAFTTPDGTDVLVCRLLGVWDWGTRGDEVAETARAAREVAAKAPLPPHDGHGFIARHLLLDAETELFDAFSELEDAAAVGDGSRVRAERAALARCMDELAELALHVVCGAAWSRRRHGVAARTAMVVGATVGAA